MTKRVERLKERLWRHLDQEALLASEILKLHEEEVAEVKRFLERHPYHKLAKQIFVRKGLNNTVRNDLKGEEKMRRIECSFRRNTSNARLRENEFIRPDLVREEASNVRSTIGPNPSRDELIIEAFNYVSKKIKYKEDVTRSGVPTDRWQYPDETFKKGTGDCEDTSIALTSLLLALGIRSKNVRMVIGSVPAKTVEGLPRAPNGSYDRIRRARTGHAWVEVWREGIWYYLETTTDYSFSEWCGWCLRPADFTIDHFVFREYCESP